jgi:hypothetical protein
MVDLDFAPDTWTPSQLEEMRGGLGGNGAGDLVGPRPNGTSGVVSRECDECGKELTGGQTRWCSIACKRRNENRRHKNAGHRDDQAPTPVASRATTGNVEGALLLRSVITALLDQGATFEIALSPITLDPVSVTAWRG